MQAIINKLNAQHIRTYKKFDTEILVTDIVQHGKYIIIRLENNWVIRFPSKSLTKEDILCLNEYTDLRVFSNEGFVKFRGQ